MVQGFARHEFSLYRRNGNPHTFLSKTEGHFLFSMESLEQENRRLRDRIAELEQQLNDKKLQTTFEKTDRLTNAEIRRYGRQLILPGFGISGKLLKENSVATDDL